MGLESRHYYGYGGYSVTPREIQERFQVCYRCKDGGYGEIGWITFKTEKEAETYGEKFKVEHSYVSEIIVEHPKRIFSNY